MAQKKASKKKASIKNKPQKSVKKTVKAKASPKKSVAKKTSKKITKKVTPAKSKVSKSKPAKKTPVKTKAPVKSSKTAKAPAKVSVKAPVKAAPPKMNLSSLMTPLDNRIIVRLSGAERMTAGGLYIPDTVGDVSGNMQGTVVATGRGHMSKKGHVQPMDVQIGDKVVFSEYVGTKVVIENEDLLILREEEVLGIVSK